MQSSYISVLDNGYVKFVDSMGSDRSIVEAARMSTGRGFEGWDPGEICKHCRFRRVNPFPMNDGTSVPSVTDVEVCPDAPNEGQLHMWEATKGDAAMLAYLYRNAHMTPFEMGQICLEVQAPIMVFREWHRHRTFSYNEMSARYIQMPNTHYLPTLGRVQVQSSSNKQGSGGILPPEEARVVLERLKSEQVGTYATYDELCGAGIAREVARLNTPVSRYSRMRVSGNLRNWLGFFKLRCAPAAQWEIRQFADAALVMATDLFPRTLALFQEHTMHSKRLSKSQLEEAQETLALMLEMGRTREDSAEKSYKLNEMEKKLKAMGLL